MLYFDAKILIKSGTGAECCFNSMVTIEELEFNVIAKDEADARSMIRGYFPVAKVETLTSVPTGDGAGGFLFPRSRVKVFEGFYKELPEDLRKRLEG